MKSFLIPVFLVLTVLSSFSVTEKELFTEAENHYRAGNYLLALDAYTEFSNSYSLSDRLPDVQYRRAVSLYHLQRYSEAVKILKSIEKRYRATRYFDYIYFWEGASEYHLENYPESINAFNTFLIRISDPELTPQSLLYKGLAEVSIEDFQAARASLETLAGKYSASPHADYGLILLFYIYLKEGSYDDLLAAASGVDEESLPEKWRTRFKLYTAEALWEKGKQKEAEAIYHELLSAEPEISSVAFRRLFTAAQRENNLSRMESLIQQAEQRFAGSPEVLEDFWVRVGIESFKQENLELSKYFLTKVWNLPGKKKISQAVPLYLAEILILQKNTGEAAALLEEYLASGAPDTGLTLLRLGDIRMMQEDYEEASAAYTRFMETYSDSARFQEAGYLEAYTQFRLGRPDSALEQVEGLLADEPEGPARKELLRLEVMLERKAGNHGEAAVLLKDYLASYPDDLKARIDLLKTFFVLKGFPEIVGETDKLFRDYPLLSEQDPYVFLLAQYLRGLALISEKNYSGALQALNFITLEQARETNLLQIRPHALYYLGWASYRLEEFEKARTRLLTLLEEFPSHRLFPQALYLAGWCSYSLEDYRAAEQYFARLAKMNNRLSTKAGFLQGKSLLNRREPGEAAQTFKSLFTVHPSSAFADDALFEYAGILAKMGNPGEAADSYEKLVRRYPDSPLREEALYKRGDIFWSAGQYQRAKVSFLEYRSQFPKGKLVDASLYWGGYAAFELGEKFEAVLHWENLNDNYRESPFRPDALKRTAEIYAGRGDYRKALNVYTRLISEYPEDARAAGAEVRADELRYLLLGLSDREAKLSSLIGRERGAKTARGREAMIELSRLYIYEGSSRIDLAYQMLSTVVEKDDVVTSSQAQFLIGEYFYRKSEPVRAAKEFLKASYLNPKDSDIMAASIYKAAEMMKLAGKERDVRELVGRLEQHFPDSQWTMEAKKLLAGEDPR